MVDINHYTLTLDLDKVEKALKNGWESNLSASRNLGKALQKCIKLTLCPEYLEKVNILLSDNDVEDFIEPNVKGYVTSRSDTMAYLAALNPAKAVLVNTQLVANPGEKPDLVILSLCEEAPDGDYPCWEEIMGKIWEMYAPLGPVYYEYNEIKKIKHLKVRAVAHFVPGEYEFKRDIRDWNGNFSFSRAVLRLCNLQDLPFEITQNPSASLIWIPRIAFQDGPAMLKREIFRIKEAEEVVMEGSPELLLLDAFIGLKLHSFVHKDGAYQTVVPIYHGQKKIGSLELNFIDIDKEAENAKDF